MRNNLKTFMESLKANHTENRKAIYQLSIVHECEHLFLNIVSPQVSLVSCCSAAHICERPPGSALQGHDARMGTALPAASTRHLMS